MTVMDPASTDDGCARGSVEAEADCGGADSTGIIKF